MSYSIHTLHACKYKSGQEVTPIHHIIHVILHTHLACMQVRVEEVSDKKSLLTMTFSAQGLDKKVCIVYAMPMQKHIWHAITTCDRTSLGNQILI